MIIKIKVAAASLCLLTGSVVLCHLAAAAEEAPSPRLLVHILDYVAKDYGGAVENGQIKSDSEYKEQVEFVEKAATLVHELKPASPLIEKEIDSLKRLVDEKSDPAKVATLSHQIRDQMVQVAHIEALPAQRPDLAHGAQLFAQNCTACHGVGGAGDGPAAGSLNPKPANLTDAEEMKKRAPLQIFNTVRLGVSGTAMAPFKKFSDQDTWDVSYFVLALTGNQPPSSGGGEPPSASAPSDPIRIARTKLDAAMQDYREGKAQSARNLALAAYLEGFELVEPSLRGKDAAFLSEMESRMMQVRQVIEAGATPDTVLASVHHAKEGLDRVESLLRDGGETPAVLFSAAAVIILREGFEAALLIIAFLSVLRASKNPRAVRYIHLGWVSALALGVVTWFLSGWLVGISGAQREMMEAIGSFFAVFVLLFVGIWLHRQTEIHRWKQFIDTRVHRALESKNLFGLTVISFVAVFREALEVVLFLRTLWIGAGPQSQTAVISGVIVALIAVLALSWALLHYSANVPIRRIFSYSSALMMALAVILVGKGLHSLQEVGMVGATPALSSLRLEVIGLYPTLQTLVGQVVLIAAMIVLYSGLTGRSAQKAASGN